jgi:hypothetical protein
VQGQLAEADMYIRWALPTFHSKKKKGGIRPYIHFTYTHVHPFNIRECVSGYGALTREFSV